MTPGKLRPGVAGALQPGMEIEDDNKALKYNPSSAQ